MARVAQVLPEAGEAGVSCPRAVRTTRIARRHRPASSERACRASPVVAGRTHTVRSARCALAARSADAGSFAAAPIGQESACLRGLAAVETTAGATPEANVLPEFARSGPSGPVAGETPIARRVAPGRAWPLRSARVEPAASWETNRAPASFRFDSHIARRRRSSWSVGFLCVVDGRLPSPCRSFTETPPTCAAPTAGSG